MGISNKLIRASANQRMVIPDFNMNAVKRP